MRDAITLFEQYAVGGVLKRKYIEENLELIGDDFLSDFTLSLREKNTEKTLKNLTFLREKSLDVRLFLEQLLFFLRDQMKDSLKKPDFGSYAELFVIFESIYGRLKFSPDPFLLLETSVFRCIASPAPGLRENIPEIKTEKSTPPASVKKIEIVEDTTPAPREDIRRDVDTQTSVTPFDFSRFIEHIRSVPKRSVV